MEDGCYVEEIIMSSARRVLLVAIVLRLQAGEEKSELHLRKKETSV